MFAALRSILGRTEADTGLRVDYADQPSLPRGAARVLRHSPAGYGIETILRGNLELVEFRPGTTYAEFYQAHASEPLCDAVILDTLIRQMIEKPSHIERVIEKYFGSFSGQIFFLGTAFESDDGRECVAYLNIKTHQPALRYLCPAAHVINHDVTCCASFLRKAPK